MSDEDSKEDSIYIQKIALSIGEGFTAQVWASLGLKERSWIGKRDKDFLGCHTESEKIKAESTSVLWEQSVGISKQNC